MKRGDIISFPDFVFRDGGHASKLLVILNNQDDPEGLFCGVLTTSQADRNRRRDQGCQPAKQEFFFPAGQIFPVDTWVLLHREPILLPVRSLAEKLGNGQCQIMATLPEQKVNEIKNCIDRHCSDWLSRHYCDLLGIRYKG
ncbi:MAG: hypothetical protein FWH34_07280 [Desulfovibrionaceae bacterium]|nr:hypothetical protein [Desulfovibrionaceae bacterium]